MNIHELKDQADNARRELERERDQVRERDGWLSGYINVLNALDNLLAKIDRMEEELERCQREMDDLTALLEQKETENADLRQQLLEKEKQQLESEKQQLESEKQQLEAEASAKPTEIHNHFGKGSSAQVFNDKVTGKFLKMKKPWKKREKKQETRRKA